MELEISEFYALQAELASLLKSKSTISLKLDLTDLKLYVNQELKASEEVKKELYKKYGKEIAEDSYKLETEESIELFLKDWSEVLKEKREFSKKVDITKFLNIETDSNLEVLLKLSK